jgi:hypothetical protein
MTFVAHWGLRVKKLDRIKNLRTEYRRPGLDICGLFICEFAYLLQKWSTMTISKTKINFLTMTSRLVVQNDGTYQRQFWK